MTETTGLRFVRVQAAGDGDVLRDWRHIHNLIIPTGPLSAEEVAERAGRNHLEVAYLSDGTAEGTAVGCSTVRPPAGDAATATVIARVVPEYRRRGFGEQVYLHALATARELGAVVIETVVLGSNEDGLRFAERHGFTETDRYVLPGDEVPYVELRLG